MYLQVYGNEHPTGAILVKPKYIPTEKIESDSLQCRFISGRKMNRLNLWADKEELIKYIEGFKKNYPEYIFKSNMHKGDRLFFAVPIDKIERIYSPKKGLKELMDIPREKLDSHLKSTYDLVTFFLESGLKLEDLGLTYSSLVGHYKLDLSDINIIVHGKSNYWKLMDFLETNKHALLKWKTKEDWLDFRKKRNRYNVFTEEEFLKTMSRKKSEGFFNGSLFVVFCAENENETWFKWGDEEYIEKGSVMIEAVVKDNFNSVVRPGYYEVENSKIIEGYEEVPIKKIVFYSRDYAMANFPGERIRAKGILEEVKPVGKDSYYRVVVGYFDSYINSRREEEYIKPLLEQSQQIPVNRFSKEVCALCKESNLNVGDLTEYGSKIIYKIGNHKNGWFATLSPKTGGNPEEDFSIQICPFDHLINFSQINENEDLAKNYGIIFARINFTVAEILKKQNIDSDIIPIGNYGKCKHPDEHIHIKIFPWRNNIGQPYTTDSSFQRNIINKDFITGEEFIKMKPVIKVKLSDQKFNMLSENLITLLKQQENEIN